MTDRLEITRTTYTVLDFLEWQRQGSLELQPYYQRRTVWPSHAKSLLIDSLLRGYPLPLIFLHSRVDVETSRTIRQVVDGQQRLRTILSFVDITCLKDPGEEDRFSVLRSHNSEFAGLSFKQLPPETQTQLLQTQLSVNVLPADVDDVTVLTIFQRMNSTGLKLSDQEIRNATYFGEFKDSSYTLAYAQYQRWLKWKLFNAQRIAQMHEVELTADLMGYLIRGVGARTKATINKLYKDYDVHFPQREAVETEFRQIFDFLDQVLSPSASTYDMRRFRTSAWFYAIFAVVSQDLRRGGNLTPEKLIKKLEAAELQLRDADNISEELHRVLRGATADRNSRISRIDFLQET